MKRIHESLAGTVFNSGAMAGESGKSGESAGRSREHRSLSSSGLQAVGQTYPYSSAHIPLGPETGRRSEEWNRVHPSHHTPTGARMIQDCINFPGQARKCSMISSNPSAPQKIDHTSCLGDIPLVEYSPSINNQVKLPQLDVSILLRSIHPIYPILWGIGVPGRVYGASCSKMGPANSARVGITHGCKEWVLMQHRQGPWLQHGRDAQKYGACRRRLSMPGIARGYGWLQVRVEESEERR